MKSLKRFGSGDDLRSYLDEMTQVVNEIVRAVGGPPDTKEQAPRQTLTYILNDTGTALEFGDVVGLGDPYYADPSGAEGEFKYGEVVLTAELPDIEVHKGKCAIVQENIPIGSVGVAIVQGVARVLLNVVDTGHAWADITDADESRMTSGSSGSARILWKSIGSTGAQWSYVILGAGQEPAVKWAVAYENWTYTSGNACYVNCYPMSFPDGAADESVSIKVWLPRYGRDEDPNVEAEDFFPVADAGDGNYVALHDYLDGKVYSTIRMDLYTGPRGWHLCDGTQIADSDPARYYPPMAGRFPVGYQGSPPVSIPANLGSGYGSVLAKGGYAYHGAGEYEDDTSTTRSNNHPDHQDHTHTLAGSGHYAQAGSDYELPLSITSSEKITGTEIDLRHAGWTGASDSGNGLETFTCADTDNRPPWICIPFFIRDDNSEGAGVPIPSDLA